MKAFVFCALIGLSQAIELTLYSEIDNDDYLETDAREGSFLEETSLIQNHPEPTKFTDGKPYRHKVPPKYREDSIWVKDWERQPHDELMNHLIKKYAKEGKDEEGKPNGRFFLNRDDALHASEPFIKKYRTDLKDKKAYDEFIRLNFDDMFQHYDVLSSGWIEVE